MKIGIFGGSFNPPHNMHINIGKYLLDNHYLDKIVYVPTGIKYEYKDNLESNKHRYNMLELATKGYDNITISKYELNNKIIHTYETLAYFQNEYPNDEIYFVCGADNLDYIDSWQKSTYILKNYKILVVNRENYDLKNILNKYKEYKENIIVCDIPLNKISSTGIREKIKRGESIKDLVRPTVEKYIKDNNLYQD